MQVTFIAARDALHRRMLMLFEAFTELYGFEAPEVFLGFPVNEPPRYCAVDEIAEPVESSGGSTGGGMELQFTLRVWLCATHTSPETAANTLMAYVDAVFAAIAADQRLEMTVDNSFPSVETAGTAANASKRHVAAAAVSIRCTKWAMCPLEIKEAILDDRD